MTTIGENVYPETPLGKVIGALIIILGVATFALPTSILTSGFVDELQRKREEERTEDEEVRKEQNLWKNYPAFDLKAILTCF
jgi:voltage-gated potassium channel